MNPNPVYKDAVTTILDLMRTTFGNYFKAYYEGDPLQIPKANFPCVIAETLTSTVDVGATGTDDVTTVVALRVVYDKVDDFGKSDDYNQTERTLRKLVEARDPATGYYHTQSIMGLLRSNLSLGGLSFDTKMEASYDIQPRADEVITSEALITVTIYEHVYINQRN